MTDRVDTQDNGGRNTNVKVPISLTIKKSITIKRCRNYMNTLVERLMEVHFCAIADACFKLADKQF